MFFCCVNCPFNSKESVCTPIFYLLKTILSIKIICFRIFSCTWQMLGCMQMCYSWKIQLMKDEMIEWAVFQSIKIRIHVLLSFFSSLLYLFSSLLVSRNDHSAAQLVILVCVNINIIETFETHLRYKMPECFYRLK